MFLIVFCLNLIEFGLLGVFGIVGGEVGLGEVEDGVLFLSFFLEEMLRIVISMFVIFLLIKGRD